MNNRMHLLIAATTAFGLGACGSSTHFTSTWRPGDAQPVAAVGMTIATVFMNEDEGVRRIGEGAMAEQLTRYGTHPVPSYTMIPDDVTRDSEAARDRMKREGVDAVLSMRVISSRQVVSYSPGYWSAPYYGSLWGYWGYGWNSVYAPGYLHTDTEVVVETLLYSLEQDKLIWAGISETLNPKDLDSGVRKVARKAVNRMDREGVLLKP
jgi:hypothetical protein